MHSESFSKSRTDYSENVNQHVDVCIRNAKNTSEGHVCCLSAGVEGSESSGRFGGKPVLVRLGESRVVVLWARSLDLDETKQPEVFHHAAHHLVLGPGG